MNNEFLEIRCRRINIDIGCFFFLNEANTSLSLHIKQASELGSIHLILHVNMSVTSTEDPCKSNGKEEGLATANFSILKCGHANSAPKEKTKKTE